MILKRLDLNEKQYNVAYNLYQNSFPYLERRDDSGHALIMQKPDYHFDGIIDNGELLGVMLYFERDNFIYLEHFAVFPEKRGNGIGAKGLEISKITVLPLFFKISKPLAPIPFPLFSGKTAKCSR